LQQFPELHFICPVTDVDHRHFIESRRHLLTPQLPLTIINGQSRDVIAASDAALIASGTATLEACLIGRPLVVAYKMGQLTYVLLKCLVKIPFIALPNLLAGKRIVPEFIQAAATPENCANALNDFLAQISFQENVSAEFAKIRQVLQHNASVKAANAIKELIDDTHRRRG
jgi:lipid-A-disaccharide synthase